MKQKWERTNVIIKQILENLICNLRTLKVMLFNAFAFKWHRSLPMEIFVLEPLNKIELNGKKKISFSFLETANRSLCK